MCAHFTVGIICIVFLQPWCLAFTHTHQIVPFLSHQTRGFAFSVLLVPFWQLQAGCHVPSLSQLGLSGGLQQRWLFFLKVLLSLQRTSKSITERRLRLLASSRKFSWFWTSSTYWWWRHQCSLLLLKEQKSFLQASSELHLETILSQRLIDNW